MNFKKERVEKPSPGTLTGAKYRARRNKLNNEQPEKLGEAFLKLSAGRSRQ